MCRGVSFGAARRQAGDDPIGGVHWLREMRGGLPGKRCARPGVVAAPAVAVAENSGARAATGEAAGVGHGGGGCGAVLWRRWICQDGGLLGFARVASGLSAVSAARG